MRGGRYTCFSQLYEGPQVEKAVLDMFVPPVSYARSACSMHNFQVQMKVQRDCLQRVSHLRAHEEHLQKRQLGIERAIKLHSEIDIPK